MTNQPQSRSRANSNTIKAHRDTKKGTNYLVRWKGYRLSENTWKTKENLQNAPELLKEYRKGDLRELKK